LIPWERSVVSYLSMWEIERCRDRASAISKATQHDIWLYSLDLAMGLDVTRAGSLNIGVGNEDLRPNRNTRIKLIVRIDVLSLYFNIWRLSVKNPFLI
jgi:hypothetical protein